MALVCFSFLKHCIFHKIKMRLWKKCIVLKKLFQGTEHSSYMKISYLDFINIHVGATPQSYAVFSPF